jgi:hypothetical protein
MRKNYIGIVSDRVEEQRVVESLAQHGQSMKDYLRSSDGDHPEPSEQRALIVFACRAPLPLSFCIGERDPGNGADASCTS